MIEVKALIEKSISIIAKMPAIISYSLQAKTHYLDHDSLHIHFPKKEYSLAETKLMVEQAIIDTEGLELEYYEIVDGTSLQMVNSWVEADCIVGCIAVYCGKVRLIDNIRYK